MGAALSIGSPLPNDAAKGQSGGMSSRIVIGLSSTADPDLVKEALGATEIIELAGPTADLPDVLIGTIEPDEPTDRMLADIARIDGVAYAEREGLYEAF